MIRVGQISFTNVLPIYHFLDTQGLEMMIQTPSQLNEAMVKGEVDIGPISSFAYAEHHEEFLLLPNLSVSAKGPVRSIFLFSQSEDLTHLADSLVALTRTSASSVALLKILLEEFEGVFPNYMTMPPDVDQMMTQAKAALLIGDDALKAYWSNSNLYTRDLGEWWYQKTGLSMTFAVWAVRREIVETRGQEVTRIYDRLMQAKTRGLYDLPVVISKAIAQFGGDLLFWERYFKGLCYDLGEEQLKGLATFYRYAAKQELIPGEVPIHLFNAANIKA